MTPIGLEPHYFFFFLEYFNKYCRKRCSKFWLKWAVAGRPSNDQNFFVKLAQTEDEQILKISIRFFFKTILLQFDYKNLISAQSACWPQPTLAKTLDISSDHIR